MKNIFILFLALGIITPCGRDVQAMHLNKTHMQSENPGTPQGEQIELKGSLMFGAGSNAITAWVSQNAVQIHFNQSFGTVSILLYDGMGNLIYSGMADTSAQQQVVIPIAGAHNDGVYTLLLNNASGMAEGNFER